MPSITAPSDEAAARSPLLGILTVGAGPGQRPPCGLRADSAWLILGDCAWADTLTGEPKPMVDEDGRATGEWRTTIMRTDSSVTLRLWSSPPRAMHDTLARAVVHVIDVDSPVGYLRSTGVRIGRAH